MTWNDTITNATDASAVAFAQQYVDAINQRYKARFNKKVFADVAAGDDFQDASLTWDGASEANTFNWRNAQAVTDYLLGQESADDWRPWIVRTTVTDNSASVTNWKLDRDYLVSHGVIPSWEVVGEVGEIQWTRRYPREHNDSAATTYTDGSAFADGHKSRQLDDGYVYERVSGAWVLSTAKSPGFITNYGPAQHGDYMGPWIWQEIRGVLNEMEYQWLGIDEDTLDETNQYGTTQTPSASDADAKSQAETDYPNALPGSTDGNYTQCIYSGSFTATIYGWDATVDAAVNVISGVTRDVDFMVYTVDPWDETYEEGTYYEFGSSVHRNAWAVYSTIEDTTAATVTSGTLGTTNETTLTSWNPTAPDGTTTVRWKGWKPGTQTISGLSPFAGRFMAVVRWNFSQKHA